MGREDLSASVNLTARTIADLPLEIEHDLATATGSLTFSHRQNVSAPLLVGLLPGWQAPYDLDSGSLDLDGSLTWGEALLEENQDRTRNFLFDIGFGF